jgi:hypothetical protein
VVDEYGDLFTEVHIQSFIAYVPALLETRIVCGSDVFNAEFFARCGNGGLSALKSD